MAYFWLYIELSERGKTLKKHWEDTWIFLQKLSMILFLLRLQTAAKISAEKQKPSSEQYISGLLP